MMWLFFHSNTETMTSAISEKPTSAVIFHGKVESAKRPNAAPRFST
jgi:hypothetical protein